MSGLLLTFIFCIMILIPVFGMGILIELYLIEEHLKKIVKWIKEKK